MARCSKWLLAETVVCGFFPTLIALVYLPWLFMLCLADIKTISGTTIVLFLFGLAAIVALRQYWLLAGHTMKRQRHSLGREFNFSVICGLLSLIVLAVFLLPVAIGTLPTVIAGWHFWILQRTSMQREKAEKVDA